MDSFSRKRCTNMISMIEIQKLNEENRTLKNEVKRHKLNSELQSKSERNAEKLENLTRKSDCEFNSTLSNNNSSSNLCNFFEAKNQISEYLDNQMSELNKELSKKDAILRNRCDELSDKLFQLNQSIFKKDQKIIELKRQLLTVNYDLDLEKRKTEAFGELKQQHADLMEAHSRATIQLDRLEAAARHEHDSARYVHEMSSRMQHLPEVERENAALNDKLATMQKKQHNVALLEASNKILRDRCDQMDAVLERAIVAEGERDALQEKLKTMQQRDKNSGGVDSEGGGEESVSEMKRTIAHLQSENRILALKNCNLEKKHLEEEGDDENEIQAQRNPDKQLILELRQQLFEMSERNKALQRSEEAARDAHAQLENQGFFDVASTKVVHFTSNPRQWRREARENEALSLRKQLEDMRRRARFLIQKLAKLKRSSKSGTGESSCMSITEETMMQSRVTPLTETNNHEAKLEATTLNITNNSTLSGMTMMIQNEIESEPDPIAQLENLSRELETEKSYFTSMLASMQQCLKEIKMAFQFVLGYRIEKVERDLYAFRSILTEDRNQRLLFKISGQSCKLQMQPSGAQQEDQESNYIGAITDLINLYVVQENSPAALMAAITLKNFEATRDKITPLYQRIN